MNQVAERDKIVELEEMLKEFPDAVIGDNDFCPLKHSFCDGFYVREIEIPANWIVVGKIHLHSHPNFLLEGEVIVVTESGGREHLKAPMSMISPAGTKRALYTISKVRWATVHLNNTNTQDLIQLEEEIIAPSFEAFDNLNKQLT